MLYRCVRSGRTLELNDPEDIEKMKLNESYVIIGDQHEKASQEKVPVKNAHADAEKVLKKRGRPKTVTTQDWV